MFFLAIFSSVHFLRAASDELSDQMPDVLRDGLTNEHHVQHMMRLSVAMRCAGIDSDRFGSDAPYKSLAQLSDATEWWKPTAPNQSNTWSSASQGCASMKRMEISGFMLMVSTMKN